MAESPTLVREFLETVGAIRGDIREIRTRLELVSSTQEKQWKRHDEEVDQRQEVDSKLLARLDHMEGSKSALKWIAPFIWAITFAAMGWMAREMWNLKEGVIVLQNTNISPEGWQEVQRAALESQAIIREMKIAQDEQQKTIEELKAISQKIAEKPVPKIPAPVYKTTIVPAPKDYTFERLIRDKDIQIDKHKKGGPR